MTTSTVEKQIDGYLALLSHDQKETVLDVVKTIVMAKQEYKNLWEDKSFEAEMESRTASYENGTAKLYKFDEMKKVAVSKYKDRKIHKQWDIPIGFMRKFKKISMKALPGMKISSKV